MLVSKKNRPRYQPMIEGIVRIVVDEFEKNAPAFEKTIDDYLWEKVMSLGSVVNIGNRTFVMVPLPKNKQPK